MKRIRIHAPLLTLALVLTACEGGIGQSTLTVNTGGDPKRGAQIIREVGCGSCHIIPGIRPARGLVGPPLMLFAHRTYIAGQIPNTPENLIAWVRDPPAIEPGTAMPNLGLDEQQARDIAAYLYTLR
jgi:cytochrome c